VWISLLDAEAPTKRAATPAPVDEKTPAREAAIVCASCGNHITRGSERTTVLDSHEHRFMNPAGLLFHIGCFSHAIGCVVIGPPSLEYAWFPGFAWRIARCGQCHDHMGWHFRSASGVGFFGLRFDRLREGDGGRSDAT